MALDKIKLTEEQIKSGDFDFRFEHFIPYEQKEEMAARLAGSTIIYDDVGIAYESYQYDLIEMALIAEYYTNIDLADFDTTEKLWKLYDLMTEPISEDGLCVSKYDKMNEDKVFVKDIYEVQEIYHRIADALIAQYEHTCSIGYKLGKSFSSILGDGSVDLVKEIAQSKAVSEDMIDVLKAAKEDKESRDKTYAAGKGVLNFSKK